MKPGYPLLTLWSFVRVWAVLATLLTGGAASGQDLCAGLVTDKVAHPMTALAKPAVGQAVKDPQFGTTIRRVSAAPSGGAIVPMYSTISAWNADESRLILYRVGQGHLLYDGRTYQFIRNLDINPADLEQVYWHTSDPDVLFYVDGNRFIRYHVSTDVQETLTTFTFCSSASGGGDPMYISWDSRRIGLGCESQRFIYDMSTKSVVSRKTMTGGVPQMAPSGTLAFLDGKVVDTTLTTLRTLALGNPEEHASLGRLASGEDTYNGVAFDGSPVGSLVTFDMTDGSVRTIVGPSTGYPYPPSGTHVSAMAYKRPGWVTASIVGDHSGAGVLDNEIVLADTNPGGKVCRVAHHRSWADDYWAEPHAVPSPSGTRILFGSDWGNSGTVDAFVVELPTYGTTTYLLTVATAGAGKVSSTPPGIDCGTDCTESYAGGTVVTLTAAAAPGSTFQGWSGGSCSGTNLTCQLTMDRARTVTATFTAPPGADFYTATPCRVLDSRQPTGPWGGKPLVAGQERTVVVGGNCGIPATATALSFNLTVTAPTAAGSIRLYAAGTSRPVGSIVNFTAGQTRANNGIARLGVGGAVALFAGPSGRVHVVLDVNGYFE